MKTRNMMVMAVVVAAVLVFAGESFAQGRRAGAGGGMGQGIQTRTQVHTQSMTQSAVQVRPEGSRRRDGSFLSTGTRANGSTTRPANGRGVMDGTGINHPQSATP
ncbi:MAG: hypothetical protein IH628_02425 [Proteobacteria bacterium]|nr:hypothetical protein [Pseudomonadota bacterium]